MSDNINPENLFQLSNGKYIMSEEISEKMFLISQIKPESMQDDSSGFSWDESGMAELFARCYEKDTRYCPEKKSWYTYDKGAWRKDVDSLLVSNKIREFVRLMTLYCREIKDEDKRTSYFKFVNKMGDRRFRDRLMKDARDNLSVSASQFDSNPYLINCLNGTYDLKQMNFREHDWSDFLTMQTNFEYTNNKSQDLTYERWERFVMEVTSQEVMKGLYAADKKKSDYLQRALGYSMLGSSKEECMFILHGKTTRNGKSTLLGAIEYLLGDYSTVSPVAIICNGDRAKNAEAASPTIAQLKGKRFVTMSESNQYGRLDEETIKQLTGGEQISARNLYESQMTFTPQFTMWLSCNDLPSVQDKSLFASDRVRVIEFNRFFGGKDKDENLKDEFKTPEAMKGIFYWLLEGYRKYKEVGLAMPEEMQKVVRKYERDNDLILQFLEERCEKVAEGFTRAKNLYDAYKNWAKGNGYYVVSAKKFNAGILTHPEWQDGKSEQKGYAIYYGISLKSVISE